MIEHSHGNVVDDLVGSDYKLILNRLHTELRPRNYLEIGTLKGVTLALSKCSSIAIDPAFRIENPSIFSFRPMSLLYQMTSDLFFSKYKPQEIFEEPIQFAFLDGMHRCEFLLRDFYNVEASSSKNTLIAIHDCLPTEVPMTSREQEGIIPIRKSRTGWWTGDVWRTALLLKRERPDLDILALDAAPTGLILITNLDPSSTQLREKYNSYVKKMLTWDLDQITIKSYFDEMQVMSTSCIDTSEKLTSRYWI